jgi:hypothetical protein
MACALEGCGFFLVSLTGGARLLLSCIIDQGGTRLLLPRVTIQGGTRLLLPRITGGARLLPRATCDVPPLSKDAHFKSGLLRCVITEVMMHNISHTRIKYMKCFES